MQLTLSLAETLLTWSPDIHRQENPTTMWAWTNQVIIVQNGIFVNIAMHRMLWIWAYLPKVNIYIIHAIVYNK